LPNWCKDRKKRVLELSNFGLLDSSRGKSYYAFTTISVNHKNQRLSAFYFWSIGFSKARML